MTAPTAYIVEAVRTAGGRRGGKLAGWHPADMGGAVLDAIAARSGIDPAAIDDVIMGCANPEAESGSNIARIAALRAGLPDTVPAVTINRFCSSGLQSIAMAALFTAHHLEVKAIAALTQSGSTALWMSRLNSGVPIFALTPEEKTRRRLSMYRDVRTVMMQYETEDRELLLAKSEKALLDAKVVELGDLIVITIGEPIGKSGGTNTMKIVRVGEHIGSLT